MTRITTTPLAVSADYADALLAARRAKNWLFLLLLLFLLAQLTIFFLVKYDVLQIGGSSGNTVTVNKPDVDVEAGGGEIDVNISTQPTTDSTTTVTAEGETATTQSSAAAGTTTGITLGGKDVTGGFLAWAVNSIVYLGTIFSILMAVVILLIVLIMLVGRLIGVSHSTSAFIWMALLAMLIFPWQLFYGPETSPDGASAYGSSSVSASNDFRVPGVLYTWGELRQDVKFSNENMTVAVQKWARFAGFPILALFILFAVQAKSGRAVKFALGEAEVHVDVATTDV